MTKDRVSGFVLLVISLAYFLLAYQIELYPGSEEDFINAQTFPKAIGITAIVFAFLIMVLPNKDDEGFASWKALDWARPALLCVLMIFYGLTIKSVGFLLSTSVFLIGGYLLLGERRLWLLLVASVPVAGAFEFILDGLLGIHIVDPFLEMLGVK